MPHCRLLLHWFLSLLAVASVALGAEPSGTGDRVRDRMLRVSDFFDTMLPGVLDEQNITFHFRPKLGDLRDYEYMRLPFELRYGLTNRWELQGGLVPFTPNPFNSGKDHRWGLGEAKFGARYDLGAMFGFFDDTTLGFEARIPLGRPPIDLNDGYTHLKPYVSAARTLLRWPSTTFFANVSYDRSVEMFSRSPPPPEVIRQHIIEVAPGILYKPSQFGYFAEYRIRHLSEVVGWHLWHEVQFGTIWDVPIERSESWRLPGKWQIELGYKIGHEEGRGTDHGVHARVNWRTSLREVLQHGRTHKHWFW